MCRPVYHVFEGKCNLYIHLSLLLHLIPLSSSLSFNIIIELEESS